MADVRSMEGLDDCNMEQTNMSRSGYSDDYDEDGRGGLWRGAVQRAINGARGQAFLRELLAALDVMPEKTLTVGELQADGEFCALGVVAAARGLDVSKIDTEDWSQLSSVFGIAEAMAREIMFENDECVDSYSYDGWNSERRPNERVTAKRWGYMRAWAAARVKSSNVRHERQTKGCEAGFRLSARWTGWAPATRRHCPRAPCISVGTITEMPFSYDQAKSERNEALRGLAFSLVEDFDWTTALIVEDTRKNYPEPRYQALGLLGGQLHMLVFTPREATVHVISLRRANRRERTHYAAQIEPRAD